MKHGLYWPILERFRSYVESLPDGAVAAAAGADTSRSDLFFPLASNSTFQEGPSDFGVSAEAGTPVKTLGEVRFGGHGGLLLVPFKDIWVTLVNDRVRVSISYPWQFDGEDPRLDLATGTLTWQRSSTSLEMTGHDLRLTDGGSEMFNGVYPAGESLADLRLHLPHNMIAPEGIY